MNGSQVLRRCLDARRGAETEHAGAARLGHVGAAAPACARWRGRWLCDHGRREGRAVRRDERRAALSGLGVLRALCALCSRRRRRCARPRCKCGGGGGRACQLRGAGPAAAAATWRASILAAVAAAAIVFQQHAQTPGKPLCVALCGAARRQRTACGLALRHQPRVPKVGLHVRTVTCHANRWHLARRPAACTRQGRPCGARPPNTARTTARPITTVGTACPTCTQYVVAGIRPSLLGDPARPRVRAARPRGA